MDGTTEMRTTVGGTTMGGTPFGENETDATTADDTADATTADGTTTEDEKEYPNNCWALSTSVHPHPVQGTHYRRNTRLLRRHIHIISLQG